MFSIGIPVYNNYLYTINTLNSLSFLDKNYDIEIILVDNNSSDQTQMLNNYDKIKNYTYIRNDDNKGFAYAVNQAWHRKNSSSKSFMMLNNDIKINNKETWIEPIINKLNENVDQLISPTGGKINTKDFNFIYETQDPAKDINYLSGWCLTASNTVWNKLLVNNNILDQDTFFVFFEDTDLGFRARKQNIKLSLVNIDVVHFGHKTSELLNTSKLYLDGKKRFEKKWKNDYLRI